MSPSNGKTTTADGASITDQQPLERQVDDLTRQLWQARDALIGFEVEAGSARARVAEVEYQLHVKTVEAEELQRKLGAFLGPDHGRPTNPAVRHRLATIARKVLRGSTVD